MTTAHFHPLAVRDVRRETGDCVSFGLEIPPALEELFRHTQGQYLNVRRRLGGEELRRSYSICSGADDRELRIAVKAVPEGKFSSWANSELKAGDTLEAMPPEGRFFAPLDPANAKHYAAFAAGSGITPVLSLVKTTLAREPRSRFTLVYGNRTLDSVIFNEALEDLKDKHLARLALYHVFSREPQQIELFNGRLDRAKVAQFLRTLIPPGTIDEAFVCGPDPMMADVEAELLAAGLPRERIHLERFGVPAPRPGAVASTKEARASGASEVTVIVDGLRYRFALAGDGPSVLEAALKAGADLPYACKAGVCCTCRAKLVEGEVRMDANYTLEADEVARGFRLACQSHPLTRTLVLDFDQR
ncbi:MAG: 1,2-phenylacetyl-CoA epoxidase subunit PaaE [Burkholderiales bacterium]